MRVSSVLVLGLIAGCKSQPDTLPARPDPAQPAVAVVAPAAPQQVRPEQVVLAPAAEQADGDAQDLYERAYMLRESHPGESMRLFQEAARRAPNDAQLAAKVRDQLGAIRDGAKERYLRGYQLKDASPAEARVFFEQVVQTTPAADELHLRAREQLSRLRAAP